MIEAVTNKQEVLVVSMRRSGHHAVINWLLQNSSGARCFLNDAKPDTNPFETGSYKKSFMEIDIEKEKKGEHAKKDLLMYNWEDCDPLIAQEGFKNKAMTKWVGQSEERKFVMVLRDPYNLTASKLRWYRGEKWKPDTDEMLSTPQLWKSYATAFLGLASTAHAVAINYNRWFLDSTYRQELATCFGLVSTDKGLEEVAKWGPNTWGDSFDGLRFDGQAQNMRVMDRWRAYSDDVFYRDLVADPELRRLSHEIFGHLEGTEVLFG